MHKNLQNLINLFLMCQKINVVNNRELLLRKVIYGLEGTLNQLNGTFWQYFESTFYDWKAIII